MNKLLKTILIISIFLPFASVQARVDNLVVEFQQTPLFKEANFLPGEGVSRWVKVTNNSGQTQRIATQPLNITDPNHLGGVLNLVIKEGGTTLYNNVLSSFLANGEVYLSDLANGANTQYDFIVSFYSGTQNTFQDKSLGFDILIGFQGTEGGILPGAGSTSGGGGGGGGGGWLPPGLTIQNEATATTTDTSATITWATSYPASSQVIYGKEGEKHTLDLTDSAGTPPKYGYERTTAEYDISPKTIFHSVTVYGLTPGTKYYFRNVSHASLAISQEHNFITLTPAENQKPGKEISQGISQGVIGGEVSMASPETKVVSKEIAGGTSKESSGVQRANHGFANLGIIWEKIWGLPVFVIVLILLIIILAIVFLNRTKKSENQ